MIRISKIDNELSIFKENVVILYQKSVFNEKILYLLNIFNVDIEYICDDDKENWGKVYKDIPVISPKHLEFIIKNKKDKFFSVEKIGVVLQIVGNNSELIEKAKKMGAENIILHDETLNVLRAINFYNLAKKNKQIINSKPIATSLTRYKNNNIHSIHNYINENYYKSQINLICTTTKTGDLTLMNTFDKNKISCHNVWHSPEPLDLELLKNLDINFKIITGVRDPISINISWMYERIGGIWKTHFNLFLHSLMGDRLFENGGNVQELFNLMYSKKEDINPINDFMNRFTAIGLDLSAYPFDKEKGYSIIKEDNIEVFVYQLERMNDIVTEMSDWIGQTPFDEWKIANEASSKWIADSYKQAQKEITFSQEYFDRCYNDPWIQHFYSQEDIEKFKARWRPHIKE